MSGRRCKLLRKSFENVFGRKPLKAELMKTHPIAFRTKQTKEVEVADHVLATIARKVVPVIRHFFRVKVLRPSEWRQLKKAWLLHQRYGGRFVMEAA